MSFRASSEESGLHEGLFVFQIPRFSIGMTFVGLVGRGQQRVGARTEDSIAMTPESLNDQIVRVAQRQLVLAAWTFSWVVAFEL